MKERSLKPRWKTKIWLTVNGLKCFYYLEEYLDMLEFKKK